MKKSNEIARKIQEQLQLVDTQNLIGAANGEVDILAIIKKEIASRGVNNKNEWVGFDDAHKAWEVK